MKALRAYLVALFVLVATTCTQLAPAQTTIEPIFGSYAPSGALTILDRNRASAASSITNGGGGGSWGSITGTLSAQTDLNTALTAKQAAGTRQVVVLQDAVLDAVTISDGVTYLVNTGSTKGNATTITLMPNPVDLQFLHFYTAGAIKNLTWNGNGKTLNGIAGLIAFRAGTGCLLRYSSVEGWTVVSYDAASATRNSTAAISAEAFDPNYGWRWVMFNTVSQELDFFAGYMRMQATADGLSGRQNTAKFMTENTLSVTNNAAGNGQASFSGFQAYTYNSSVAYGAGATNDKPLHLYLGNSGQMFTSGNHTWGSPPTGVNHWLSFQNAPLQIGSLTSGGAGQIMRMNDVTGAVTTFKGLGDGAVEKVTATNGSSATVSNNTSNLVLRVAAAGTIATFTLNMPATPFDGQQWALGCDGTVTALTHSGNGATLRGALTTCALGKGARYLYTADNTTWVRTDGQ